MILWCPYVVFGTSAVPLPARPKWGSHTINLRINNFFVWIPDTTLAVTVPARFRKSASVSPYCILHQTWFYRSRHYFGDIFLNSAMFAPCCTLPRHLLPYPHLAGLGSDHWNGGVCGKKRVTMAKFTGHHGVPVYCVFR